ncbi:hypothetical protein ACFORG_15375 [Lutimaribacter marinistellae]|uniref:CTP synthetase n=1 Tax=Lutimaribacter marinistellae TaxID=1820329 RepID=A0ABV7TMU1_9RHOB
MIRLAGLLFSLISTALAGTGVIVVLVAGFVSLPAILGAAIAGAVLAAPVSWLLAKRLYEA